MRRPKFSRRTTPAKCFFECCTWQGIRTTRSVDNVVPVQLNSRSCMKGVLASDDDVVVMERSCCSGRYRVEKDDKSDGNMVNDGDGWEFCEFVVVREVGGK